MIMEKQHEIYVPIKSGGFCNFDSKTINNTAQWLKYFSDSDSESNSNDIIYERIIKYLDTNPDYLDFEPKNASTMKWFITKLTVSKQLLKSESHIKLIPTSKYYERLHIFDYIGVKYFNYNIEEI